MPSPRNLLRRRTIRATQREGIRSRNAIVPTPDIRRPLRRPARSGRTTPNDKLPSMTVHAEEPSAYASASAACTRVTGSASKPPRPRGNAMRNMFADSSSPITSAGTVPAIVASSARSWIRRPSAVARSGSSEASDVRVAENCVAGVNYRYVSSSLEVHVKRNLEACPGIVSALARIRVDEVSGTWESRVVLSASIVKWPPNECIWDASGYSPTRRRTSPGSDSAEGEFAAQG